jgi:hypothetical protein
LFLPKVLILADLGTDQKTKEMVRPEKKSIYIFRTGIKMSNFVFFYLRLSFSCCKHRSSNN